MINRLAVIFLPLLLTAAPVFSNAGAGITGAINWETMQIEARVSLNLEEAGIRMPLGRTQGERLINDEYRRLIQPILLNLQVDSSTTIGDLVMQGHLSLWEVENFALGASSIPPALSPDLRNMTSTHVICINRISSSLLRHTRPLEVPRTLNPVSTANYTGVIIIATESLPSHGMIGRFMPAPGLFPRIWDSNMDLVFERNMLDVRAPAMVRYAPARSIFHNSPSGLSPELSALVGERPLRIFARGVFGSSPTDLIIDRADALRIISTEENRRLLTEGRIAIILDDSVLRDRF